MINMSKSDNITEEFLLRTKIAIGILKTRTAIGNRIYSSIAETYIRGSEDYPELLALRKSKKKEAKKEAAKKAKEILKKQLAKIDMTLEDFLIIVKQTQQQNMPYQILVEAEKRAFADLKPLVEQVPVYRWLKSIGNLDVRLTSQIIAHVRDIRRFRNPSAMRKYFGLAPKQKLVKKKKANFNPERKGLMLGKVAQQFIRGKTPYKAVYDEKKRFYQTNHPEWSKLKCHRYAIKPMMQRFNDNLWVAWYKSLGLEPPTKPYPLLMNSTNKEKTDDPSMPIHTRDYMIVPYIEEEPNKS